MTTCQQSFVPSRMPLDFNCAPEPPTCAPGFVEPSAWPCGPQMGRPALFHSLLSPWLLPLSVFAYMKSWLFAVGSQEGAQFRAGNGCGCGCGCGCQIPPPPGAARLLGEVVSTVMPGTVARLDLRVTNQGEQPRVFKVELNPAAPDSKLEGITRPEFSLGAFERARTAAQIIVPHETPLGTTIERVLIVRGCSTQAIRWVIQVGCITLGSCHFVDVCDCAPRTHEWSDHFHC
jgi:hypothetical protein